MGGFVFCFCVKFVRFMLYVVMFAVENMNECLMCVVVFVVLLLFWRCCGCVCVVCVLSCYALNYERLFGERFVFVLCLWCCCSCVAWWFAFYVLNR